MERPSHQKLILYYGLPVAAVVFVLGTLLLALHSRLASAGIAACGAVVAAAGVGLAVDWRGGTSAFMLG